MEIKKVEALIMEIKREWDLNPLGWRLLRGRDPKGRTETYISGAGSLWFMKTELRNPYQPIGVGTRIDGVQIKEVVPFMVKGEPFPIGECYPVRNYFSKPERKPLPEKSWVFTLGIGTYSTESTAALKTILSEKQEKLEQKLNRELDRLLDREGMFKEYA